MTLKCHICQITNRICVVILSTPVSQNIHEILNFTFNEQNLYIPNPKKKHRDTMIIFYRLND